MAKRNARARTSTRPASPAPKRTAGGGSKRQATRPRTATSARHGTAAAKRKKKATPARKKPKAPAPLAVLEREARRPAARQARPGRMSPLPPLMSDDSEEPLVETPTSFALDLRRTRDATQALEEPFDLDPNSAATLAAGDRDVRWETAASVGDETPGGDNPTPDMDVVDLIGRSLGVEYEDAEELKGAEKIAERDKHRWELDPQSSEDYRDRGRS